METHSDWALARVSHGGYLGGKERPEHYIWRTMIARCTNPNQIAYQYYGARGIKVCKRWLKYENFLADMGLRPSPDHSLDRKNTNLVTANGLHVVSNKRTRPLRLSMAMGSSPAH